MSPEELSDRLLDFAVETGRITERLPRTRFGQHVAGQLVRSGTSPAPNYEEGCAAESRRDFIHKLSVCLKELRESRMWCKLILKAEMLPDDEISPVYNEADELCRIIRKSVFTAKQKR
jgi:four helix bundle protein